MKFFFALILSTFFLQSKAQEVEVVIASGLDWAQNLAMSSDNRFVAKGIYNSVSIWDVNTGRMIRDVQFTDNLEVAMDSIWFSDDNKTVMVGIMVSNDLFKINLATGKSTKIEGTPFDYSNYTYSYSNFIRSTMHLYDKSKNDLRFASPDGKKKIIYKKIKNPYSNGNVVPKLFQVYLKIGKNVSEALDTVSAASFVFSEDSKYIFMDSKVFDLESGRLQTSLKIVPYYGPSISFLSGTQIPVTAGVNTIRIWNFPEIEDIKIENLVNFKVSEDGNFLICERYSEMGGDKIFVKVDIKKRKIVGKEVISQESGYLLDYSSKGDLFCFLEMSKKNLQSNEMVYKIRICDTNTGKTVKELDNHIKAFFTNDENYIITDSAGSYNFRYSFEDKSLERFPTESVESGTYIGGVSIDHKYLMGSSTEMKEDNSMQSKINAWDAVSGKVVFEVRTDGIQIGAYQVSKDGKYLSCSTSKGNDVIVFDFKTSELLYRLKGHTSIVQYTYFSDDSKRLISSGLDGTRRVWNLEDGSAMVSLISTGENDYAIVTPEQYYYATKGAQKLIHFVKGTIIYPFAQFDLKYNRPDIILESMEAMNQDLIKPFYLAYQKRLSRMGFTEEMLDGGFHLPIASIVNSSSIPLSTKTGTISLDISAYDEKFNLNRLVVRVNEVPIHGKDGIDLSQKNIQQVDQRIEINLSHGINKIDVSVMNEKGVESIAANLSIEYLSDEKKSNLYLFTIGVSDYKQDQYNLNYAAKDANDLTNLFKNGTSPFENVHSINLTNDMVNKAAIIKLKEQLQETDVNDAVCIFFAGHGLLDAELNYFLASYDIDFNSPEENGIPYDLFENLLDNIPARKKLILIDACHSGEIDKDEVVMVESEMENNEDLTFRAVTGTTLKRIGLNNSFELMKELFTDIRKSSGTMIISSAGGMEYAMEGDDWNNGVFTYSLINGLRNKKADLNNDGKIMLSEMNSYVREEVYNLTNGRQQPTNRAEVLESDWQLW